MVKRTFREIRNEMIKKLRKVDECSYSYLEIKVNTNWKTIKNHIENLEFFGVVEVTKDGKVKLKKTN